MLGDKLPAAVTQTSSFSVTVRAMLQEIFALLTPPGLPGQESYEHYQSDGPVLRFIRATEAKEEEPSKKKQRIRAQMRPGEPDLANRRSLQIPPGTPQQAT